MANKASSSTYHHPSLKIIPLSGTANQPLSKLKLLPPKIVLVSSMLYSSPSTPQFYRPQFASQRYVFPMHTYAAAHFPSNSTARSNAHCPNITFLHFLHAPNILKKSGRWQECGTLSSNAFALSKWPARPKRSIIHV